MSSKDVNTSEDTHGYRCTASAGMQSMIVFQYICSTDCLLKSHPTPLEGVLTGGEIDCTVNLS